MKDKATSWLAAAVIVFAIGSAAVQIYLLQFDEPCRPWDSGMTVGNILLSGCR